VKRRLPSVTADQRLSVQALLDSTLTAFGQVDMLIIAPHQLGHSLRANFPTTSGTKSSMAAFLTPHLGCQIFAPSCHAKRRRVDPQHWQRYLAPAAVARLAYSAAKAAVVNLTKNIAREYAPKKRSRQRPLPGFFPPSKTAKITRSRAVENIMRGTPMQRFRPAPRARRRRPAPPLPPGRLLYHRRRSLRRCGFTSMRF